MAHPLLFDGTWLQQNKYESAEAFYQTVVAGTSSGSTNKPDTQNKGSQNSEASKIKSEIAQARQNIQKALNEGATKEADGEPVDPQMMQRIKNLEQENNCLRKSSQDLTALVKKLEQRITALEKSNSGSAPAPAPGNAASKPAADESDDDDFFNDSSSDEDEETLEAKRKLLEAYNAKKSKKPTIIAKSSLLIDVKPWSDEEDMKEIEAKVRSIVADGLVWGQAKLIPVGYGIKKLQINAVIEDDKISTDFLEDEITGFEDLVQSMDIAAFNKI